MSKQWYYDVELDEAVELHGGEALSRSLTVGNYEGPRLYPITGPEGVKTVKTLYAPFKKRLVFIVDEAFMDDDIFKLAIKGRLQTSINFIITNITIDGLEDE